MMKLKKICEIRGYEDYNIKNVIETLEKQGFPVRWMREDEGKDEYAVIISFVE